MSRMLLGKLDIDVLVHLAVIGPVEASDWKPLVKDPNELGRLMWSVNYEAAASEGDDPPPDCNFAEVPVGVSAVEGLKQIQFFIYQSADDEGRWNRDGLKSLLGRLRSTLVPHLPGYSDAPWGWARSDVAARSARAPKQNEPPPDPQALVELCGQWSSLGMPLVMRLVDPINEAHSAFGNPDLVIATGWFKPHGAHSDAPITVTLCPNRQAAEMIFVERVREALPYFPDAGHHVYRFGNLVVASRTMYHNRPTGEEIDAYVARLGTPDAHWMSEAAPLAEFPGEVVANYVRLTPDVGGVHWDKRAVFARTPKELASLAAMIADPVLRSRLEEVSTRKHTILLLRGVVEVEGLQPARLYVEPGEVGVSNKIEHRLIVGARYASAGVATVILLGRLPMTPFLFELEAPNLNEGFIASGPPTVESGCAIAATSSSSPAKSPGLHV